MAKMWAHIGSKIAKGYFHTSHLTPNPVFPKNIVLEAMVSIQTKQTKRCTNWST